MEETTVPEKELKSPNDFSFPFKPYDIQVEFMKSLFTALENGKLGIFESPTGTGKSLSLLCGSLTWLELREASRMAELSQFVNHFDLEAETITAGAAQDWIKSQADLRKKKEKYFKCKRELDFMENMIGKRRKVLERRNKSMCLSLKDASRGFRAQRNEKPEEGKIAAGAESDDFADLFLDDYALENNSDSDFSDIETEEEPEFQDTKIIFASRTHSQLSQFVKELQRTSFAAKITAATLGSRQNLCINPEVVKLKNISLINERCLDLQKKSKGTKKSEAKKLKSCDGCPFFKQSAVEELKKRILAQPLDIEEIVTVGRDEVKACPYYASRKAAKEAQMVLLPYNTILHSSTRESIGINVKGSVVLLDEAHNIIESISNMYATQLNLTQLQDCMSGLDSYLKRFMSRFNSKNLLRVKQIKFIMRALLQFLEKPDKDSFLKQGVFTIQEFKQEVGIENQDLYSLVKFCDKYRLAFKLKGYLIQQQRMIAFQSGDQNVPVHSGNPAKCGSKPSLPVPAKKPEIIPHLSSTGPQSILAFVEFLKSLKTVDTHGRIIIDEKVKSYKFLLLSVAAKFQKLVVDARSLILGGGTMKPYEDITDQLFQGFGSRIHHFACDHIIPKNNLVCIPVAKGPNATVFDFTYKSRKSPQVISELAQLILNVIRIVPGGVVCFLPSYEYEHDFYNSLKAGGLLEKISGCKKVFREPKGGNTDSLLEEYTRHVRNSKNGALLFAVVGGKLSEGINFSDDLGRCVIVVGLPYPNTTSVEIQEKVRFVNSTYGQGKGDALLTHMCSKAVNQSIGRAIRHANDYAVILLVDQRYEKPSQHALLPNWIQDRLQQCQHFGQIVSTIAKFFAEKKARH